MLSPITVFLKSPELGNVPNLDFEKEQVGLETVKDLGSKMVLDAFTCVECGRCQVNCPAWGAGKELNPKTIILQTQEALLAGERERKLGEVYTEKVLWQCTTCGACENQCPVGIEHLPILIGARRGLVSNGEAPEYLGAMYNHLERRGNIWGLGYDQRQKFVDVGGARDLRSGEARRAGVARLRRRVRGRLPEVAAVAVRDPARQAASRSACCRRSGATAIRPSAPATSTCSRSWPTRNIEDLKAAGPKKILTSCPHCVKTIGDDYRKFGYEVEIVHSAVFVEELTRGPCDAPARTARDRRHVPRSVLSRALRRQGRRAARAARRASARDISEPERNRENPFCCGAGGGLLFADKEEEPGTRISDVRFKQLQDDRRRARSSPPVRSARSC